MVGVADFRAFAGVVGQDGLGQQGDDHDGEDGGEKSLHVHCSGHAVDELTAALLATLRSAADGGLVLKRFASVVVVATRGDSGVAAVDPCDRAAGFAVIVLDGAVGADAVVGVLIVVRREAHVARLAAGLAAGRRAGGLRGCRGGGCEGQEKRGDHFAHSASTPSFGDRSSGARAHIPAWQALSIWVYTQA